MIYEVLTQRYIRVDCTTVNYIGDTNDERIFDDDDDNEKRIPYTVRFTILRADHNSQIIKFDTIIQNYIHVNERRECFRKITEPLHYFIFTYAYNNTKRDEITSRVTRTNDLAITVHGARTCETRSTMRFEFDVPCLDQRDSPRA